MRRGGLIFQIADEILVASGDKYIKAQIVSFRASKGNYPRSSKIYGCDVITETPYVQWIPLDRIVEWNKHKAKDWFE
jgi:hypothetical protein